MERFRDLRELRESKDSLIDRIASLTDEQKKTVKDFFNTHNDYEKKIDWNRVRSTKNPLTWKDFEELMDMEENKLLPKEGIEDLTEGVDYEELPWSEGKAYAIYNHRASVAIASNNTEPKVWTPLPSWYQKNNVDKDYPLDKETGLYGGAKWCTAMHHTDHYFREYTKKEGKMLFYFIYKGEKYAVLEKQGFVHGVWNAEDGAQDDELNDDYSVAKANPLKEVFKNFFTKYKERVLGCEKKFEVAEQTPTDERDNAIEEYDEGVVNAFEEFWGDDDVPYDRIADFYIGYGEADEVMEEAEIPISVDMIENNLDMEWLGEHLVEDDIENMSEEELKEVYGQYYNEGSGEFEWEYREIANNFLDGTFSGITYADDLRRDYSWLYNLIDFNEMAIYALGWEDCGGYWFH